MLFVADDLGDWLIGLLANAGRKKLTALTLGDEQQRALRRAATSAVLGTAAKLDPSGGGQAERLAMVINEVFQPPDPRALRGRTLLEGLRAEVVAQVTVLDDAGMTGTGQSSAEVLGVEVPVLAEQLADALVREIVRLGVRDGALAPLASQLGHDLTHLQGQRLEGMVAGLTQQVRESLPHAAGGPAARPVRLLPRPVFLAGREDLLAKMDAQLAGDGVEPRMIVMCGLGGAGKTSAALEYAYRHLAEHGVVWQFAAEDPATLAAGFGDLAALLRPGQLGDPVAAVHAVLAASEADWLLLFDNAPGLAAVRDVLPPAGSGCVLVTTRDAHWPGGYVVDVPVLDREVAAGFLQERTGSTDQEAAGELADELGGLPLALEQAAAYMRAAGRSIAAYLEMFRRRRDELLACGDPVGYDEPVGTAWALAFDQLQAAPLAVALLRLLACCAPELIPVHVLLQPQPGLAEQLPAELAELAADVLAADNAIAALRQFSLVSLPENGLVSVHRLVQAVTLGQLSLQEASQWRTAARSLIEAALPADPQLSASWPSYAVLLPHAEAALPAESVGMASVAVYLGSSGNYAAARDLTQRLAAACLQVSGAEHPDTLLTRANVAYWTGEAGDPAAARDQYAALLPVTEQALGAEHPQVLACRGNLARWTGEAGDPAAARDQYAALLPVTEQVLGAEHPQVLACRGNLARWTGEAGDPAAARDQYAALLPVTEQVLGAEHPQVLTYRGNLAFCTGQAGDAAAARDLFAAVLRIRERVLGAEHPDTLYARANLADWTGEAGDPVAARDQWAALLPVRERVLGARHPDTRTTRRACADWRIEAERQAWVRAAAFHK